MHLGGGPTRFAELLDAQLTRRADHRVPRIDHDPGWVLAASPADRPGPVRRVARLARQRSGGNAWLSRGGRPGLHCRCFSWVASTTTRGGSSPDPCGPGSTSPCAPTTARDDHRLLDLRTGTLVRSGLTGSGLRSMRFVSAASPHAMAMRVEGRAGRIEPGDPLRPPTDDHGFMRQEMPGIDLVATGAGDARVVVAAQQRVSVVNGHDVVERLAAWAAPPAGVDGSQLPASTSLRQNSWALTRSWPSTDAPGPRCGRTRRS